MSARVKKAAKRLQIWLNAQYTHTMSTQYAVFLEDVALLIAHVKKGDKRV